MEIVVNREALLGELALAQGSIERRTTIPVLGHVQLKASGESVYLTATDLELAFLSKSAAEVKKEGEALVPAKKLYDYVSLQPAGQDISLKVDKSRIVCKCGRNTTRISILDNGSFPEIPAMGDAQAHVPANVLAALFSRVAFAISAEESRFTLNGALMELTEAGITVVATDGHRLAFATHPVSLDIKDRIKAIVSQKAIAEIVKLGSKAGEDDQVSIFMGDSYLYFGFGTRRIYARSVVGNFPDYNRVLPKNGDPTSLDSLLFRDAVNRVSRFADERSKAVKFNFSESSLKVTASTYEVGESEEILESGYQGDGLEIGLNAEYVLDFFKFAGAKVSMFLKDGSSAVEFQNEGDPNYRYVVMPMRV